MPVDNMPAFPTTSDNYASPDSTGMTLRDYIAIHASDEDVKVQANVLKVRQELGILPDGWNVTARYMHADAMIKEREK